jgi:Uma2 family endonuclease
MSAALKLLVPDSLDAFLEWEKAQALRHEWDGVQPIAMVGGTQAHSLLASRLAAAIEARFAGRGCTVFRGDVKLMTAAGSRVRYPDLVLTCAPIRPTATVIVEPLLIVEVLSESTAAVDLGLKRQEYAALPSLAVYVVLSTEEALGFVFRRGDGFAGAEAREALDLPELGLAVPLAPLYAGLLPPDLTRS